MNLCKTGKGHGQPNAPSLIDQERIQESEISSK